MIRLTQSTMRTPIRRTASVLAAAAILAGLAAGVPGVAAAADPVAIVEEVGGASAGVEEMDYLVAGQVVRLGKQDRLVVSYMSACLRETIRGGVVTIGDDRSAVQGGEVKREKFVCDAGRVRLTAAQSSNAGATTFRGGRGGGEITIYARAPVVDGVAPGRLVIERVDRSEAPVSVDVAAGMLKRGKLDMRTLGVSLEPGGRYRLKAGGRELGFVVSREAKSTGGPIPSRLLRP